MRRPASTFLLLSLASLAVMGMQAVLGARASAAAAAPAASAAPAAAPPPPAPDAPPTPTVPSTTAVPPGSTSPPPPVLPAPERPTSGAPAEEPSAAADQAGGVPIAGYDVDGILVEPRETIEELLRAVAPEGSAFVASGPADRFGTPLGTVPRLRRALELVGYGTTVTVRPGAAPSGGAGLRLYVTLQPYDRVRYIFVSGNGTIRQDEIQRRISIRTGHTLPPPGPDRDAAIERERQRVIRFLRDEEGYFEANVRIDLVPNGGPPAAVDFQVRLSRGPGYPIGPISLSGNTVVPSPQIEQKFRHLDPLKLWTGPVPFTVRRMRDDMAKVADRYRDEGYPGARVSSTYDPEHSVDATNKNVAIGLTIHERKHVTVSFEGNHNKSVGKLRDQLTLDKRGAYDDYEVGNSADAIQRFYQDEGYFFARVQWRRERRATEEEHIVFQIDEGPELKVREVEFVGNQALSASELSETVTVRTFPFLGIIGLGEGGYVTARQVSLDGERLVEHYRGLGFPDVEVQAEASTSPNTFGMPGALAAAAETVSRDATDIFVRFTIHEGPRVKVNAEDFQSLDGTPLPYSPDFLHEALAQRLGAPYRPGLLKEDARRIERLLGDMGYPATAADSDVERTGDQIRIIWKIKMGPRVRVGPIFVRGNFVTVPRTILEQIPIHSGDFLTTTAFERGQRNLGYLQLFNNASPISFPGKDEGQAVVPMVVEVEERHDQYNVVHVGGGGSTEQAAPNSSFPLGWYVRAGYDNRNLFGHAWNLSTTGEYGQSLTRATSTFLDRRFLGTLFRFDISGQYFQQATARLGDIRSWGGSIGFGREMYPGVDASIHYNLRNTTHTEILVALPGPYENQHAVTLGTAVGSISLDLQWLRLDNRLVPTRGFKFEALTEIAPQALSFGYADVSFIKVGGRSTIVVPLFKWLMLRHALRYDQGFPLGGESLLPKVERYFAGGDTTIRGYKLDRARIDSVTLGGLGGSMQGDLVQYRPLGGNLRILENLDLQFPISPPWYGSVFFDNGIVADSFGGVTAAGFRHSVGVAPIIVKVPFGDVTFAWGWPLDPGPGDTKIGVFIVNIGLLY